MITELLLQERRQDFPFLGGILITQAGIASYQCLSLHDNFITKMYEVPDRRVWDHISSAA